MRSSIIIPTKDRPEGLRNAVRSALAALPDSSEIIVVDDGSSPPAVDSLSDFVSTALRIIRNPGPHGPSQARNHGVAHASGQTVFFLDDDDEFISGYCERILEARAALPKDCVFGHCAPLVNDGAGSSEYQGRKQATGVYGRESELQARLAGLGMGFWIDRHVFNEIGGIDTEINVNEDTELSIRLASSGYSAYYDAKAGVILNYDQTRPLGDKRSITKSATARERAKGFEYILNRHDAFLASHPKFRRLILSRVIKYRSRGRHVDGWKEFCRSRRQLVDRIILSTMGTFWLKLSIALRRK